MELFRCNRAGPIIILRANSRYTVRNSHHMIRQGDLPYVNEKERHPSYLRIMSFAGRVIAITGAASGIGRALTLKLVDAGATVYASDIDSAGLAITAEQCPTSNAFSD